MDTSNPADDPQRKATGCGPRTSPLLKHYDSAHQPMPMPPPHYHTVLPTPRSRTSPLPVTDWLPHGERTNARRPAGPSATPP
eukprot:scaffold15195_cov118-Isochrysis_galbana.AAC.1